LLGWLLISSAWGNTYLGLKDSYFIACYILPFLALKSKDTSFETVFLVYTTFFLINIFSRELDSISIADSTGLAESSASFAYGAFALYFVITRKKFLAIMAIFLLFISLKRIALLGFIFCFALWLSPNAIQRTLLNRAAIIIFNIFIAATLIIMTSGAMADLIETLTGKSTNHFTMGRMVLYYGVVLDMIQNPQQLIFGNGAGTAYEKVVVMYDGMARQPNLHSDTLKILYEFGFIFFAIFFYKLSSSKNLASRIMIIYICILFSTDNVLIYPDIMFILLYATYRLSYESGAKITSSYSASEDQKKVCTP